MMLRVRMRLTALKALGLAEPKAQEVRGLKCLTAADAAEVTIEADAEILRDLRDRLQRWTAPGMGDSKRWASSVSRTVQDLSAALRVHDEFVTRRGEPEKSFGQDTKLA